MPLCLNQNQPVSYSASHLNLVFAWLWIVLGFASGTILGMKFHREEWLGGYASHRRRLYRLGHISFFGLGAVNFMFWLTARALPFDPHAGQFASWAFALGALTMPLCCFLMAHWPRARTLFAVPVGSLLAGGGLTLWQLFNHQLHTL
jgi:hypothetical protein